MADDADQTSRGADEAASDGGASRQETAGPDEIYCPACGRVIPEMADFCPHCGDSRGRTETTEPRPRETTGHELSPKRKAELESIADTDIAGVVIVSFLITPVGYLMIGKPGWAALNFFTFNYFLLGPFIVPFHVHQMITEAKQELREAGARK